MLNLSYKRTVFDSAFHQEKECIGDDNFDVGLDAAGEIHIIRPILSSDLIGPLITEIRMRFRIVLRQTLESPKPQSQNKKIRYIETNRKNQKTPKIGAPSLFLKAGRMIINQKRRM